MPPSTAETIAIQGTPESRFKITGSANGPTIESSYGTVAARPDVGWSQARFYGLDMEKANLQPSLENGHLVLPVTAIPGISGGQANFGMDIDLTTKVKTCRAGAREDAG